MSSREQFEVWVRRIPFVLNLGRDPDSGNYILQEERDMWAAWQASRQALVVELPVIGGEFTDIQKNTRNRCRAAIEAAGVKVKA